MTFNSVVKRNMVGVYVCQSVCFELSYYLVDINSSICSYPVLQVLLLPS